MEKNSLTVKLIVFSLSLLIVRVFVTGHYSFLFLCWNLFLAWIPYWLINYYEFVKGSISKLGLVLSSIIFLPNSPYIITDLFHLKKNLVAPIWLDTLLILSFALTGLIFFVKTFQKLLIIITNNYISRKFYEPCKILLIILCSYGVYLGRFLRFNSWDIISNPLHLVGSMWDSVFSRQYNMQTFGVTLTMAGFLYIIVELFENHLNSKFKNGETISDKTI